MEDCGPVGKDKWLRENQYNAAVCVLGVPGTA